MKTNLTSLDDPKYKKFIDHVNTFKQNRYYIIDFVSIEDLRSQGKSNDEIADITSEYFDDHEWPVRKDATLSTPEHWEKLSETQAKEKILPELCGGRDFGHLEYAIQPNEANKIWQEFVDFFDKDRVFYEVSLGNRDYVFMWGVLIVDKIKAGVLNVVQDD